MICLIKFTTQRTIMKIHTLKNNEQCTSFVEIIHYGYLDRFEIHMNRDRSILLIIIYISVTIHICTNSINV